MSDMSDTSYRFIRALDLHPVGFLTEILPPEWENVRDVIVNTGANWSDSHEWCPGWTNIPRTVRGDLPTKFTTSAARSALFRAHDFLHQLWAIPTDYENYRDYDLIQICGEIVVLYLTEWLLIDSLKVSTDWGMWAYLDSRRQKTVLGKGKLSSQVHLHNLCCLYEAFVSSPSSTCYVNGSVYVCPRYYKWYREILQADVLMTANNREIFQNGWRPGGVVVDHPYPKSGDAKEMLEFMWNDFMCIVNGRTSVCYTKVGGFTNSFPEAWQI